MFNLAKNKIPWVKNRIEEPDIIQFFKDLRENSKELAKKRTNSYWVLMVLIFIWIFIELGIVTSGRAQGFTFGNLVALQAILPLPIVYYYNAYMSHSFLYVISRDILEDYYKYKYPEMKLQDITELLKYPSFENIEYVVNYKREEKWYDFFLSFWTIFVDFILYILPGIIALGFPFFHILFEHNHIPQLEEGTIPTYPMIEFTPTYHWIILGIVLLVHVRILVLYIQSKNLIMDPRLLQADLFSKKKK